MPEYMNLSCTALLLCAELLDREKRRKLELSYLNYTQRSVLGTVPSTMYV